MYDLASKDSKVPHSTTNISVIERNFSQCILHYVILFLFSSSVKETLFLKEVSQSTTNNSATYL